MLYSRLCVALLLAAACLLMRAGFSRAERSDEHSDLSTATAVPVDAEAEVGHDAECKAQHHGHIVACEHRWAALRCGYGYVIRVLQATYGRQNVHTCGHGIGWCRRSNTRCYRNVYWKVARRCNGKRYCAVYASNKWYGDPCWGTYKYLRVKWVCRRHCKKTQAAGQETIAE